MSTPAISVIVPVYQAEKFLHKCVDSILAQTCSDFELLLVDDGSTDRSGAICDDYATRDSRVKTFHIENGGVSRARQYGLDHAQGEYVIHADSDDWVEPTMLSSQLAKARQTDADMVICDYLDEQDGHSNKNVQQPSELTSEAVAHDLFTGKLHGSCWNKLVRRSLFTQLRVRFPDIQLCEDLYINIALLRHPLRIAYLPEAFYHYVHGANALSITRAMNPMAGLYAYKAEDAFRVLLADAPSLWQQFICRSMPWMSYLSLYYGCPRFHAAYGELLSSPAYRKLRTEVKIALHSYTLGRMIIRARQIIGKLLRH